MTRPRDIGTRAESAVVAYLRTDGFPHAERRALFGALDRGDIVGIPGVVVEVKGGHQTRAPSDTQVDQWIRQTSTEARNASANFGLLVLQRHGYSPTRAGHWWTYLTVEALAHLLDAPPPAAHAGIPLRLTLAQAVALMRHSGYGDTPS